MLAIRLWTLFLYLKKNTFQKQTKISNGIDVSKHYPLLTVKIVAIQNNQKSITVLMYLRI